ncbi:MAG: glycosyltransferase [candidate division WOR-3 bacterium]
MGKKPRVCIIRQYYFPKEAHLRRDVNALIEGGFEVDVICARDKGERLYERWNEVDIYRIPVIHLRKGILRYMYEYLYFFVRATLLVTKLFFKKRYDCIEVDTLPDFLVFCTIIPKLFNTRIILYLFENMPLLFSDKYNVPNRHPLIIFLRMIELLSVKFADQVIITHARCEKCFENSVIILNVPDEMMFLPVREKNNDKTPAHSDIYNAKEVVKIVTHSTLTEIYGIQNIIKAVALLKDRYTKIRCEIIGEGEYKWELMSLVRLLHLDGYVQFKGYVAFEEMSGFLKDADIGIVSVLSDYLLPNKLFEYIALKIPVICSSVKAIKDFFNDDALFFYTPHDYRKLAKQIEWVMFHYDIALDKAKKAYMIYQEYSWSKLKNIYISCHHPLARRQL